jgi:hypothetical protein
MTPKPIEFKLRTNARYFSDRKILKDLKKIAKNLRKDTVSFREYIKYGMFSTKVYRNRFGSWNNALKKAGLGIIREHRISNKVLFDNLEKIWRRLGRQPFYSEMRKPLSEYTPKPYTSRFGGWMKACKTFIKYKKNDPEFEKLFSARSDIKNRNINEKVRLQVFKRDNYACVICGKSPATHRGIVLHIDHKLPYSKGGDNSLKNLRTLCDKCNLGRGNDESL